MREIIFRVWHKKRNTFLSINEDPDYLISPSDAGFILIDNGNTVSSNDLVWQQYTGIKDKNNVPIYEGDIVRFLDGECTSTESGMDCDEFENIGEIVWEVDHWDVTNRNGITTEEAFSDEFEVVGNIYQHKHLLK